MATIFMGNIMAKVRDYADSTEGKKRMAQTVHDYQHNGVEMTGGGSMILTYNKMRQITETFIDMLRMTAYMANIPQSVYKHFDSLESDDIMSIGSYYVGLPTENLSANSSSPFGASTYNTGSIEYYMTSISFGDARNGSMYRPSLLYKSSILSSYSYRTGEGIDNIVLLFNNGYGVTRAAVRGFWDGHEELGMVWSKRSRAGLHFIEQTIRDFNKIFRRYGVTASYEKG